MPRKLLYLAIVGATALAAAPINAQENEEAEESQVAKELEEIVVTGSYIKRDSFDSSVPVTVVDQVQIENNATPNLGEVLSEQTFNYGTDVTTNTYAARAQGGNNSQANLRGLGPRATLNLVDGKRSINGNLNNSLPQIAIQRIDILKDGASALYGTDAVAGVVNIITNKNYEGVKFNFFRTQTDEEGYDENQYEFMFGNQTDNGHFTLAASYAERSTLEQVERPQFLREGFERSGTGNPGDWLVPERDASGNLTGEASRMMDPGCGVDNGPGTDVAVKGNHRSGDPNATGTNCRLHFGEFWNYVNPQDKLSLWSNFQYEFNDQLINEFDFILSRLDTDSRGSPQNPGGRTEEFPIVLGTHPGNPYRAMDADGNPLYAQDADGDGIPDRDPNTDVNGDGVPDVILAANPTDPGSGIAFNEDVDVVALRIFGKLGTLPTSFNPDGSNLGSVTFDTINYRFTDTLTWAVPDTTWEISGGFVYQQNKLVRREKNTSQQALVQGLRGNLKAMPTDDSTTYWNPFSTQELTCTNRNCSTGSADFANTQAVVDAVNIEEQSTEDTQFYTYDLLATGDMFDLPTGDTVAGAFGYQYRNTDVHVDLGDARNRCDWHEGGCGYDYRESQDINSLFFETLIPLRDTVLGDNLEFTLAGRYSDYGGNIGDSTDPKVSVLYQPTDIVSLRASWSTAFTAPTIEQLYEPTACGLETASDPLTGDLSQSFRVACEKGNPNLQPETAEVSNIGASFALLEGDLNLGVDYSVYDFEDRISSTTLNQVLSQDYQNFLDAGNDPDDPSDVNAWINGPNSDPAIQRDVTGVVTRVETSQLNAQTMKHSAYDFYARYNLMTNDLGMFGVNFTATYVKEFLYDLGEGLPSGDGAGKQNEEVEEVPPMPEWNLVSTFSWNYNNHTTMFRARWNDGYEMSFNSGALQSFQRIVNGTLEQDPILYMDLTYSYTFEGLVGDSLTTVELGAYNIADEYPDPILNLGGIETFVHDPRGRRWTLRLNHEF